MASFDVYWPRFSPLLVRRQERLKSLLNVTSTSQHLPGLNWHVYIEFIKLGIIQVEAPHLHNHRPPRSTWSGAKHSDMDRPHYRWLTSARIPSQPAASTHPFINPACSSRDRALHWLHVSRPCRGSAQAESVPDLPNTSALPL